MATSNLQGNELRVLTIGHSNHPLEHFVHLLRLHAVDVVVDTRSYPYSNFAVQYDQEPLRAALRAAKFQYIYLGIPTNTAPKPSHTRVAKIPTDLSLIAVLGVK